MEKKKQDPALLSEKGAPARKKKIRKIEPVGFVVFCAVLRNRRNYLFRIHSGSNFGKVSVLDPGRFSNKNFRTKSCLFLLAASLISPEPNPECIPVPVPPR
jgi:hypothetical protein